MKKLISFVLGFLLFLCPFAVQAEDVEPMPQEKIADAPALEPMTEEQLKAQDELTKNLTQFQDASKRLSGAFQGLEAGFLSFIGNTLGRGGGLLNTGITGLASSLMALPAGVQAIVYGFGKKIQY